MQERNEKSWHFIFIGVYTPLLGGTVAGRYSPKEAIGVSAFNKLFPLKPKNPI